MINLSLKRKLYDFLCAFVAFSIVLLSIAALTGESFFEGSVSWSEKEAKLSLFGSDFTFDKDLPKVLGRLFSFNDVVLGDGASHVIRSAAGFLAGYVSDGISIAYHVARMAVGAE